LIFGLSTSILSLEATTFLSRKGVYETSEEFNVIRLFGGEEKPFLLPFYVSKCAHSIKLGSIYSMRGGKISSYPYHGKLDNSL
jgi:hypothetical protein